MGAPKEQGDANSAVGSDNNNFFSNPAGAAYIFTRSGSTWSQQAYLKVPEEAGGDVSGQEVVIDGSTAAFSPHGRGQVQVYTRSATTWTRQAVLESSTRVSGDNFGRTFDLAGDRIAVAAEFENRSGAVHVFTRSGTTWTATSRLTSPNAVMNGAYGHSVGLSSSPLAVGAIGESPQAGGYSMGRTYVYRFQDLRASAVKPALRSPSWSRSAGSLSGLSG